MKPNKSRRELKESLSQLEPKDFDSYEEYFWALHLNESVVIMHLIGFVLGLAILPYALYTLQWPLFVVYFFFFYGFGFLSHWIFDGIPSRTAKEAPWGSFIYAVDVNLSFLTGRFQKKQHELLSKYPKLRDIYLKKVTKISINRVQKCRLIAEKLEKKNFSARPILSQRDFDWRNNTLREDKTTCRKIDLNLKRNKKQDNTPELDQLAEDFRYEECRDEMWNPEEFSLLYGTPIWDQASPSQKILLNQLYWVAYYSQIISAETATIFLNQTSAAGLYSLEDFRQVCDTLDLESAQERAHISAFKKISEETEKKVFGKRLFTYPMKNFATETMIFQNTNRVKEFWKRIQLDAFSLLSSHNAFIACQYFTVRGLRTLNGKIVQHQLSQYYSKHPDKENAPIPSKVSYHHFLDESYHFNSSTIIGHDVIRSLKEPTAFEKFFANLGLEGTQKDHRNFNITVNGIFWYEPAIFPIIYELLLSEPFQMESREALEFMEKSFTRENKGIELAANTHRVAQESYAQYLEGLDYINKKNRDVVHMKNTTVEKYLKTNQREMKKFKDKVYAA